MTMKHRKHQKTQKHKLPKTTKPNNKAKKIIIAVAFGAVAIIICVSCYLTLKNVPKGIDYDTTTMNTNDTYELMGNLYSLSKSGSNVKSSYLDKKFRIRGVVGRSTITIDGKEYYTARINQQDKNSSGKSASGPYFKLEGKTLADANSPDDQYPKQGTVIEIVGIFKQDSSYKSSVNDECNVIVVSGDDYQILDWNNANE